MMPSETAVAGAAWAKWGHVFAGALGVAATIAWGQQMSPAQRTLAAISGMVATVWGTPVALAVLRAYTPAEYFSQEVLDGVTGLIGFCFGMFGIFLVTGILRMAEKFSQDPWWVLDRIRGKKGD